MITENARYPDPSRSIPPKVRFDGDRKQNGWDLDALRIEGNEGGIVSSQLETCAGS